MNHESQLKRKIDHLRKKIMENNHHRKSKLGSGRKSVISAEEEEFIAKAIAEKGTAHSRQTDSVIYLNQRVNEKEGFA